MNRFAPSATGRAHPGTLLAALVCWLDARSRGDRILLRLEDLDPQRCRPAYRDGLLEDLAWFGLDWEVVEQQSAHDARHRAALRRLAAQELLYPCSCSRREIRERSRPAPDGGWAYDNRCRDRHLPTDWEDGGEALRVRLPDAVVAVRDEDGSDRSQAVTTVCGDPIVRRRDGAVSYHLASVVDDAAAGVTRVVRGRDLAAATAVQCALHDLLEEPRPVYRHHLLLLEPAGGKFAKFHGAVSAVELRAWYAAAELCGLLAACAGLRSTAAACRPSDLIADFAWERLAQRDQVLAWTGRRLEHRGAA